MIYPPSTDFSRKTLTWQGLGAFAAPSKPSSTGMFDLYQFASILPLP